jgi:hypothetical protein
VEIYAHAHAVINTASLRTAASFLGSLDVSRPLTKERTKIKKLKISGKTSKERVFEGVWGNFVPDLQRKIAIRGILRTRSRRDKHGFASHGGFLPWKLRCVKTINNRKNKDKETQNIRKDL